MASRSDGAACTVCGRETLRRKLLCGLCSLRHDGMQIAPGGDTPPGAVWLPGDLRKAQSLRQWFLSKWYGHGGLSVRIDGVVQIFNPRRLSEYNMHQRTILHRADRSMRHTNERRMFLQCVPPVTCGKWHQQNSSTVDLCEIISGCILCSLARNHLDALGDRVGLLHEPVDILSPQHSAQATSARRRACFVVRATLGRIGWARDVLTRSSNADVDSWLVESPDREHPVAYVDNPRGVLITHAILFTES